MKTVAILQARMSSTRLPGKVLAPILGEPMLARQIERLRRCTMIDQLVLATSTDPGDDPLADLARHLALPVVRGSLSDVLDRFHQAFLAYPAEHVVRLTGDCPLADWRVIDDIVREHQSSGADYTSNCLQPTFPDGLDAEVMGGEVLQTAWREATRPVEREHVTYFIHQNPARFVLRNVAHATDLSGLRWTVDEPADLAFVQAVYSALYPNNPDFAMVDVLEWVANHPETVAPLGAFTRNAGLAASLAKENPHG
jgi:spore coat polysaccharide biosynthesis protein SpsF